VDEKPKSKWYTRSSTIFIGFLVTGPLVLPLVWANREYSTNKKILITVLILLATYALFKLMAASLQQLQQQCPIF